MSPRPRKVSDDEVFLAARRAITKRGPKELTLGDIAAEAGVTAGRLVQRFGGKRKLLLALSSRFAGYSGAIFAELRRAHLSPLAALRGYASGMAALAPTPEALARNLAYLQIDLTDPEFRAHLVAGARGNRREIESLVRAAVRAGELAPRTSARRLARTIETTVSGSLMTWACYQEGTAARWLRQDLEAVLEPHLVRG